MTTLRGHGHEERIAYRTAEGVREALGGSPGARPGLVGWPKHCAVASLLTVPILRVVLPARDWRVTLGYVREHPHCWLEAEIEGGDRFIADPTAEQFGRSWWVVTTDPRVAPAYETVAQLSPAGEAWCRTQGLRAEARGGEVLARSGLREVFVRLGDQRRRESALEQATAYLGMVR